LRTPRDAAALTNSGAARDGPFTYAWPLYDAVLRRFVASASASADASASGDGGGGGGGGGGLGGGSSSAG